MPSHEHLDERSLAMHRLVAEKLRREPALFDRVRQTLARWRVQVAPATQPYVRAWEAVVAEGLEAALAVATERSQRAAALRQSSPFAAVLTPSERFAFLKAWRQGEVDAS